MDNQILTIQEKLKEIQTPKRYLHSLGVQYTSSALAMRYECDIKLAELAGLLHDCAKCISDEKMLESCKKYEIPMTDIEESSPFLLHGKLGAYYAKSRYNIDDERILSAITYHTTGKAAMTKLEQIVFVADYIEPSRKQLDGLDAIRKIAFIDLNQATFLILQNVLNYLRQDSKNAIDPATADTLAYYRRLCNDTEKGDEL